MKLSSEDSTKVQDIMRVIRVISGSQLPVEAKYNLIFSNELSRAAMKLLPDFEFYDPDMDYEDDVLAFVQQLQKYIDTEI